MLNWQVAGNLRQQRKIRQWELMGLSEDDLKGSDYLLTQGGSEDLLLYVAQIDGAETEWLAENAGILSATSFLMKEKRAT